MQKEVSGGIPRSFLQKKKQRPHVPVAEGLIHKLKAAYMSSLRAHNLSAFKCAESCFLGDLKELPLQQRKGLMPNSMEQVTHACIRIRSI